MRQLEDPGGHFFNRRMFIDLFLLLLGLCCSTWAFPSCGEGELLFTAIAVLLLLQGTGSKQVGFNSCSTQAQ